MNQINQKSQKRYLGILKSILRFFNSIRPDYPVLHADTVWDGE